MNSTTRWEGLYEDLLGRLERQELKPGDRLPSERELIKQTGLSRNTVRAAVGRLESEGLIEDLGGSRGRVVSQHMRLTFDMSKFELGAYTDDPAVGKDQWLSGVEAAGWEGRQVVVDVRELPAPAQVAEFLQLPAVGTPAVRRRRLRLVSRPADGIPERVAMIADTWTPPDIAYKMIDGRAPLMNPGDTTLPGGIYYALGFRQVRFIDNIEVRMPTTEEAELMALSPTTAVGQHARIGIDETGRRVRVLIHIWAGDRQVITYDLPVPERRLPNTGESK
ncbi:GntR family transcriptional regulator [Kribbella sandramycini]|uniref:GntR family transcriptional regulator n=1 Tax=Kribbella sandramycini TaxID=60450 RepID=A0A7Y4L0H7_9ACTN|nr:GntR family transcriptional regulator [Kribbella sandramycini]NOL42029.1 GntR family transcriptional regulator [Kribbella sandramycini]